MTTQQVNSAVNSEELIALNILEFSSTYTGAQCVQCGAQFRLEIATEEFNDLPAPSIQSAVICPNCGKRSFIFCWSNNDNSIPWVSR